MHAFARRAGLALLLMWLVWPAQKSNAQGPHEIALIVNENAPRSRHVANLYARLRHVPPENIVYVSLPDKTWQGNAQISPDDFRALIFDPVQQQLDTRKLDHVVAWVYAADFPVRITTKPPMSLMGATFVRGQWPDMELVRTGRLGSRLFAGPDTPDGPVSLGGSFSALKEKVGDEMPLPSMMLAYMGERGNDIATVEQYLRAGVVSDGSRPRGDIYFVEGNDVRARTRTNQFTRAQAELETLGINAQIVPSSPRHQSGIMGLMVGAAAMDVAGAGSFRPGAIAEHLTSHAAEFHVPYQTKLTEWLKQGATASAGTVTEPYAMWTKFPHARLYAHYARGHSAMESFYLSIRSPYQVLLVGEPLATPWRAPFSLTFAPMDDEPVTDQSAFVLALMPERMPVPFGFVFMRNGLQETDVNVTGQVVTFDTRTWEDGWHAVRAVVYVGPHIRHQLFVEHGVVVNRKGRRAAWVDAEDHATWHVGDKPRITMATRGQPDEVGVWHNGRWIARADAGENEKHQLEVNPGILGPGPVTLHAIARYADGMEVRSPPVRVEIEAEPAD
jgi:uncharacterized protein (TIGR03790 family)